MTKHVEWYYGDFSDPEAVSGSSTICKNDKKPVGLFCCAAWACCIKKCLWKTWQKNVKKIIQKVIDLSTLRPYNRDSS